MAVFLKMADTSGKDLMNRPSVNSSQEQGANQIPFVEYGCEKNS